MQRQQDNKSNAEHYAYKNITVKAPKNILSKDTLGQPTLPLPLPPESSETNTFVSIVRFRLVGYDTGIGGVRITRPTENFGILFTASIHVLEGATKSTVPTEEIVVDVWPVFCCRHSAFCVSFQDVPVSLHLVLVSIQFCLGLCQSTWPVPRV